MAFRLPIAAGTFDLWTCIKWGFMGLLCISLATTVFFIWQSDTRKALRVETIGPQQDDQAHVDKPLIIERKAGKMTWRLKAKKAAQELRGSMHLSDPQLELFSESGKRIPMSGREAWFDPLSKAIRFKGDVVIRYGDWTLYGDDVRYDHTTDTIHIPGDFRIDGKLTRVRGRGLTAWRSKHHIRVDHAVWIEDRHPRRMQVTP